MSIMAKTPSGYKKIGSAYLGERPVDKVFNANGDVVYALQRELTGVPPLLFKGKEQSELLNYRIYGDTVDGESVGDRTANLIQGSIKNANIGNNGKINTSNEFILVYAPVVTGESYTISNNNGTNVYAFYNAVPSTETATSYDSNRQIFSTSTITFVSPITGYIAVRLANTAQDIMINPGSTALPYEPYGYKVPVTVEGKNLLQITATSTTKNGVTFTVNSDGSVTCNGTADKATWFDINRTFDVYSPDGRIASIGNQGSLDTFYMNIGFVSVNVLNSQEYSKTTHTNNSWVHIVIASGYTCDNLTLYPMIRKADIEDDTYEPYHAPVTTPIYLPEQIKKVGDEADYIDYGEQKQHFADGTSVDVTLPALPTLTGTNTMSVDTEVQPSRMDIKGRIKTLT